MTSSKQKVYTSQFWLLCLSSLLFFASFNMLIPELPAYLSSLGGAEYKGLIISLFTITAMVSRPFSGKMADKVGRIPVMVIGTSVCFISSLLYPVVSSVAGFLLLRLVHGFSTGFTPTGLTAYLSDIIPAQKRGEAMGLLGTAGTVGMAAGPAIGGAVANNLGLNFMFYTSSGFAIVSILILTGIKETLQQRNPFTHDVLKIHKRDLFEPRVLVTCIVMVLTAYAYGAVYTVIPDFGEFVGIRNKGVLFTFLTVASLSVRLIAGKASDYYGRRNVLIFSTGLAVVAMVLLGFGSTPRDLMIAVTLYGLAQGITSPTLFAWATDLSDEKHKGRGISSLYIFMEMGIGMGAFASGWIYGNRPENFFITFIICAVLAGLAFLYLVTLRKPTPAPQPAPVTNPSESVGSELDQL
ncbi:MAG: MFS transporter [Cyclobacteriaceae bacterium]|nr:MFS transporter [Cyclobacteriaceae bacterium]